MTTEEENKLENTRIFAAVSFVLLVMSIVVGFKCCVFEYGGLGQGCYPQYGCHKGFHCVVDQKTGNDGCIPDIESRGERTNDGK